MVATVLTVYGIETFHWCSFIRCFYYVATVLTVYGIETLKWKQQNKTLKLQQCLPFTVLKLTSGALFSTINCLAGCNSAYRLRYWNHLDCLRPMQSILSPLQQCLPFTVLKLTKDIIILNKLFILVATVLTVYGIETAHSFKIVWTQWIVATVLTVYGIETYIVTSE